MPQSTTSIRAEYDELLAKGLSLDLTRGKPSSAQLDLSNPLLSLPGDGDYRSADGTDVRNYGGPDGLPELRAIFAELLGIPTAQLLALDSVTLPIMHGVVVNALLNGRPGGDGPWRDVAGLTFLCPVPGYDRHFTICEALGIKMIPVPFVDGHLDLDTIASLVSSDASIRGMWSVPTYANPTGYSYTAEEVQALVSMPSAAPDFTLMWDNAYALHHLSDVEEPVYDVLGLAAAAGHPDRPIVFASTSKITFAGAGVGFVGGSAATIEWVRKYNFARNIGPDKVNQLRHVRFLKDAEGVRAHMRENRDLLVPKFDAVLEILEARLEDVAEWTRPTGGYFITLEAGKGCASRAIALAKDAGIAVTAAGAPYPYGDDPHDSTIRIAPSFPPIDELRTAIDGLCTCILLAQAERAAL
ncbi:MAG TPA: aminotransferase class I/II-fold pyridoxal phosphate-dependent enzyme [Galbitalea sp.]